MSVVYQAIVARAPIATVIDAVAAVLPGSTGFATSEAAVVVLPMGPGRGLHPQAEECATAVSKTIGDVLLAVYDDRIGLRRSAILQGSRAISLFTEADEEWVPLDQQGDPIINAPRVRVPQFDPHEEYEVVTSAIDLGLTALGVNPPFGAKQLREAILARG